MYTPARSPAHAALGCCGRSPLAGLPEERDGYGWEPWELEAPNGGGSSFPAPNGGTTPAPPGLYLPEPEPMPPALVTPTGPPAPGGEAAAPLEAGTGHGVLALVASLLFGWALSRTLGG